MKDVIHVVLLCGDVRFFGCEVGRSSSSTSFVVLEVACLPRMCQRFPASVAVSRAAD